MDHDSKEFQKTIARIQIWSSAIVTVGGVAFGIGASMWVTAWTMLGTASTLEEEATFLLGVINFFNSLGPVFSIIGFIAILIGFFLPIYLLRPKHEGNNSKTNTCWIC